MRHSLFAVVGALLLSACAEEEASLLLNADASAASPGSMVKDGGLSDASRSIDAAQTNLDREKFASVGIGADLDYSKRELWACRPGNEPNECLTDLTATEFLKDGGRRIVEHQPAKNPDFDCFYVYPTVSLQGGGNMTDFSEPGIKLVRDPIRSQAARFNRVCELYAPLYRQVSLLDGGYDPSSDRARAVQDVTDAFAYFTSKLSKGRKFVLISHSQGTQMLTALLSNVIDQDPELRERMISAVMLGGGPTVPEGEVKGGSFQNIPVCEEPGQTGCVIAYVGYDQEAPPTAAAGRFGKDPADAGTQQVICTEPGKLAGNGGKYKGSYFRLQTNNASFAPTEAPPAGVTTPFILYRDYFDGECVREAPFSYLEVAKAPSSDDQRAAPSYRNKTLEMGGWGLHLVDFNIELDDLIDAVDMQAKAAR